MRRIILIVSLFIFSILGVVGQYNYMRPEIFYMPSPGPDKYYVDKLNNGVSDNPGLQYRLQTGMHFNTISGFNSLTSWVSPKVLLPVNSRIMIEAGFTYLSTSFPGSGDADNQRVNDLITYARGIYSVNTNFTIYGQVAKSLINTPGLVNTNFESVMVGMEYFVTPNFRIGASIRTQRGIDPFYLTSPYPYHYGGSGWDPYY